MFVTLLEFLIGVYKLNEICAECKVNTAVPKRAADRSQLFELHRQRNAENSKIAQIANGDRP